MAVNCIIFFLACAIALVASILGASVPCARAEDRKPLPPCTQKLVDDREVSAMPNLSDADYSQKLAILANAKQFSDSVVGESATPTPEFQAFLQCAPRAIQHKKEVVDSISKSTAAGKIYLVTLLYAIDNKIALEELRNMQSSKETVVYKSGCEVFNASLGAIATDLLKSGRYLGWTLGSK